MSDTTITDLPTAGGIDPVNDWLAIDTAAPEATNKINRNILLGVSSQPLGLTDTQSPTNKTFDNTNTITVKDSNFTMQDNSDTTKQAQFQLSGITTATTRTYTLPNASVTLASLTGTETLTNKTLTSPAITGGTIDNSTITVDSITGHTSSTVVTVGNVQLNNGTIGTSGAVITASIATAAVTPEKLVSGAGTGWAWQNWTPSWTNVTVGNGTVTAKYVQVGKGIFFRIALTLGTTSAISGQPTFTLPVTAVDPGLSGTASPILGYAWIEDTGVTNYQGPFIQASTTEGALRVNNAASTYLTTSIISSTIPMTWGNGDSFNGYGYYEAA